MSYIVKIYTPQELHHSSYIQTGLFELEQDSFLRTKVVLSFSKRMGVIKVLNSSEGTYHQPHPKTSFYQLIDTKTGIKINFATDLYDASNSFSKYALDHCDYVFKRNYNKKEVSQLEPYYQNKIVPLGLTFRVQSSNKRQEYKFFIGLLLSGLRIGFKMNKSFFSRLKKIYTKQIKHWKSAKTSRNINEFEQNESSKGDFILFQTRCFFHEKEQTVKEIHTTRYQIILLLREKFPSLFKGGFISSSLVKQNYADAITNLKTDPKSYLDLVKKSKIAIYTKGIQDSPAWKMAEYLSQGKVVIAEKITTELPIPLEHENHVLFFNSIEEIPSLIEQVLSDSSLNDCLSRNGRTYYETVISPKVNVMRIIDFMLTHYKK